MDIIGFLEDWQDFDLNFLSSAIQYCTAQRRVSGGNSGGLGVLYALLGQLQDREDVMRPASIQRELNTLANQWVKKLQDDIAESGDTEELIRVLQADQKGFISVDTGRLHSLAQVAAEQLIEEAGHEYYSYYLEQALEKIDLLASVWVGEFNHEADQIRYRLEIIREEENQERKVTEKNEGTVTTESQNDAWRQNWLRRLAPNWEILEGMFHSLTASDAEQ